MERNLKSSRVFIINSKMCKELYCDKCILVQNILYLSIKNDVEFLCASIEISNWRYQEFNSHKHLRIFILEHSSMRRAPNWQIYGTPKSTKYPSLVISGRIMRKNGVTQIIFFCRLWLFFDANERISSVYYGEKRKENSLKKQPKSVGCNPYI